MYAYAINNPIAYVDINGEFIITTTALLVGAGALLFGTIGGIIGNQTANSVGATGWNKVGYVAGYAAVGAIGGGILGYLAAPSVIAAGISGLSITSSGITIVSSTATTAINYVIP